MSDTPNRNAALRKVLVIGGGFSGMAAAIALAQRGLQVELVEQDPGWRSYGAGISLGGATLRAFAQLGVLDAFLREGSAHDGVELLMPSGQKIGEIPTPRLAGPEVPGGGAIMRPVLAQLMAEATRAAGVAVRLGTRFEAVAQDEGGVDVVFDDGGRGRYDLVVGADGLYSALRRALFPEAAAPRYTGQGVWRAVLPRPAGVNCARMWLGPKHKPGVNPVSRTQMYLFLTEDRAQREHLPEAEHLQRLKDLLAPFPDPLLRDIRAQLGPQSQIVYRPLEQLLLPQPWFRGRVVLIGDAVHATTPHLASGACIGIEDGLVLAEEVARASSLAQALERFQTRRWERCRMVTENSARLGEIEVAGGDKQEHARLMRESMAALAQPI